MKSHIIYIICTMIFSLISLTSCNRQSSWIPFNTDANISDNVTLSCSSKDLWDGNDMVEISIINESDYVIDYFYESISVQKEIDGKWFAWNNTDSDLPGAEIEHECQPHHEDKLLISSQQLIPIHLKEEGTYRLFLPFSSLTEYDTSTTSFAVFEFTV